MPLSPAGSDKMLASERQAAFSLASLYVLRMLGFFLILPVFELYAGDLEGATPLLAGLALGIYGLTQACLQIPFGMLSDRFGRKRIIIIGLLIFAAGSVVAALADSITGVIVGRALQGMGAIAAVILALAADLSREEQRTKVMAIIGISIGLTFAVALVLGPILHIWIGVQGIFWLTAGLALVGIAITHFVIPQPSQSRFHRDTQAAPAQFRRVLRNPELLRLDFGIFVLHLILMATFIATPLALRDVAGLPAESHPLLYLLVLVLAITLTIPFILLAEKYRQLKTVLLGAIFALCLSELLLMNFHHNIWLIGGVLVVFFTAFNILEASLPSLLTKLAPADAKGTASGVYSSAQFFGAFVGGAVGGWLHGVFDLSGVFAFAALAASLWFLLAFAMREPLYLSSKLLKIGIISEAEAQHLADRLRQVPGVAEAVVIAADEVAYLKVDKRTFDPSTLQPFAAAGAD